VLLPLVKSVDLLKLDNIVMEQVPDQVILMLIRGPLQGIQVGIIKFLQLFLGKLGSFRDDIHIQEVLHTLGSFPIHQLEKFFNQLDL